MIEKWISSLRSLLHEQETLKLSNIRLDFLHYFFAFPLAMVLINIQDHIWVSDLRIYRLSATTALFIAFALSASFTLLLATPKNISAMSKYSAAAAALGLFTWLFLPDSFSALVCSLVFMAGIGGCLSCGSFSFVFSLNNAERFLGTAFMLLTIGLAELGSAFIYMNPIIQKLIPVILTAGLCACMFLSKAEDYANGGKVTTKRFEPGVFLALFIVLSYFAIRIMNFHIPAFQQQSAIEVWGSLTLLPVVICVLLQVVFKCSSWLMCIVFFISSIVSYALWYAGLHETAYLFAGIDDLGLFVSFYLIGAVTNKFCDFRMHKRLMFMCMIMVGCLFMASELLIGTAFTNIVALAVSTGLFVVFLLLSPAFYQHLFFSDWSEEFRKLHMTEHVHGKKAHIQHEDKQRPSLDDTNLSFREKQVVLLLLRGLTLRQIAPELGLTFSTVATYSKTIYKKLNINSRAELFLMFGHQGKHTNIEL